MKNEVFVKDFTSPGDADSAAGIREAIKYALKNEIHTIIFEAGKYTLKSFTRIDTEGMRHDIGCVDRELYKDCHIAVLNAENLSLIGQADEKGECKTILAGDNPGYGNVFLPAVLWCENCSHLSVKNIGFTRDPEFTSAGEVIKIDGSSVWIDVFEGNPCYDGMEVFCANRFTSERELLGESVTYGQPIKEKFSLEGGRRLRLDSEWIAKQLQVGELFSWHQGAQTDFQVCFRHCNNLNLNNLRTYNSNGFCMMAEGCCNIRADKVVFKPEGNRLFTGPRDAWKLFKCSGIIDINHMYIEGVRMDGQNLQNTWFSMVEKINDREALFHCLHTSQEIEAGSFAEFYSGSDKTSIEIKEAEVIGRWDKGYLYRFKFVEPFPDFADNKTVVTVQCLRPEFYVCRNSTFRNIAGAGQILKTSGAYLENCRYQNTMNPGILIGSEFTVHNEGVHGSDIWIERCEFDNCGFVKRYEADGCIGIRSEGFQGRVNKNIFIIGSTFKNSRIGINVQTCDKAVIYNCKFEKIREKVSCDSDSRAFLCDSERGITERV